MLGFAHGLHVKGVSYEMPDVIVGTSAGSVVGSTIAGGHLERLTREFDFFGDFPRILACPVPTPKPNPGQMRALEICRTVNDGSIETIQSIGRGAMASRNPPVSKLQDMIDLMTGNRSWPSSKFHTTTMDCYTGERLVVSEENNIPIPHAVSASMSLPGIFGPTWIGDRICMDGGMSPTSTHSDLLAGAKRVLVISLTDGSAAAVRGFRTFRTGSSRRSGIPRPWNQDAPDRRQSRSGEPGIAVRDRPRTEGGIRPCGEGSRSREGVLGLVTIGPV